MKAAAAAAVCTAAIVMIKSYIPEFTPFAEAASILVVVFFVVESAKEIIPYAETFLSSGYADEGYVIQLFKAVGIAVIAEFSSELCRDNGNSAVAFALETAAKTAIISMSMPMLLNLADMIAGLLKG